MAALLCGALLIGCASLTYAKTLRWSSQGDPATMDPHAQNDLLTNAMNGQVYEMLVNRDKRMGIVPVLAESWTQPTPTTWRFKLRPSVKVHDGTPLTADDVAFSIERAQQPTSLIRVYAAALGRPKKIDALTVELTQEQPNPILLQHLSLAQIMSKAWCEAHKVTRPQDFKNKEETFAARNANGTGPYVLKSREADIRTVYARNPNYWRPIEGNLTEVIYLPIKSDATRIAALLSGEVDLVIDPPVQDIARLKSSPGVRVLEGAENRVLFLGMDQFRDELLYSNVKGNNPFKDKWVRQALYQAIDIEAIRSRIMRGLSLPTGAITPSPLASNLEHEKRLPLDRDKAKKLLAEAGYREGFEVGMECTNNRYINDEEICQALVAMFAQVGVKAKLTALPRAVAFSKWEKTEVSFYMYGWGGAITDAQTTLTPVLHSKADGGRGDYNFGRFANPRLDALIDQAAVEADLDKRKAIIAAALRIQSEELYYIPLHRQMIPWAMRSNVNVVHRPDNWLEYQWISVQ